MPTFRRKIVALCAVVAAVGACYFWPADHGPRLTAGPVSVSYDRQAPRLTAIVDIRNSGDRSTVASITNAVFVDSRKQMGPPSNPHTRRTELTPEQSSPVVFVLEGASAADVWNGVRLMEVTIDVGYGANATRPCSFSFMGRFYPEIKKIGTVSSVTSPGPCRGR